MSRGDGIVDQGEIAAAKLPLPGRDEPQLRARRCRGSADLAAHDRTGGVKNDPQSVGAVTVSALAGFGPPQSVSSRHSHDKHTADLAPSAKRAKARAWQGRRSRRPTVPSTAVDDDPGLTWGKAFVPTGAALSARERKVWRPCPNSH